MLEWVYQTTSKIILKVIDFVSTLLSNLFRKIRTCKLKLWLTLAEKTSFRMWMMLELNLLWIELKSCPSRLDYTFINFIYCGYYKAMLKLFYLFIVSPQLETLQNVLFLLLCFFFWKWIRGWKEKKFHQETSWKSALNSFHLLKVPNSQVRSRQSNKW